MAYVGAEVEPQLGSRPKNIRMVILNKLLQDILNQIDAIEDFLTRLELLKVRRMLWIIALAKSPVAGEVLTLAPWVW